MPKQILILGADGFIGSHLSNRIISDTDWEIFAMDVNSSRLEGLHASKRFNFTEGDISTNRELVSFLIKKCDVVLPLVAIATPSVYVKDPIGVFKLDFEENLIIIKQCLKYGTRVLFPSTSEVYGMCDEEAFDEEKSNLVLGPIRKERWIYSSSKQLLDRVIYAYGNHHGLKFTIFRPFNWIGPNQDDVSDAKEGSSRVVSQFISNIIHGKDIVLVDGGSQRRSFTYVDDGIEALMTIIKNKDGCAEGRIFNIGNPENDISIRELANIMIKIVGEDYPEFIQQTKISVVPSKDYYGENYQDVSARVPSIENARRYLGWKPVTDMQTSLKKTLNFYFSNKN